VVVTLSSVLLRQTRRAAHLTQRGTASAAHVPQASIGRVEAGSRDVSVATLDAFLRPTGHRLIAVPLRGRPVAESAIAISEALDHFDEPAAFREFIQTNDDLTSETAAGRIVLSYAPPPPTGDRRFDALLAALVDFRLNEVGAPHPQWIRCTEPLTTPWYVDPYSEAHLNEISVPIEFARRQVILDISELSSA
jgi:transcriptional regulator with XRE-family HTH domain